MLPPAKLMVDPALMPAIGRCGFVAAYAVNDHSMNGLSLLVSAVSFVFLENAVCAAARFLSNLVRINRANEFVELFEG